MSVIHRVVTNFFPLVFPPLYVGKRRAEFVCDAAKVKSWFTSLHICFHTGPLIYSARSIPAKMSQPVQNYVTHCRQPPKPFYRHCSSELRQNLPFIAAYSRQTFFHVPSQDCSAKRWLFFVIRLTWGESVAVLGVRSSQPLVTI